MGEREIVPASLTSSKTGDSGTFDRMTKPTATSTMLDRKGIRQASDPPRWTLNKKTRLASSSPTGKPAWTIPVKRPLRRHGACS